MYQSRIRSYTPEVKTPKEGVIEEYLKKGRYSPKKSEERKEKINKKKQIIGRHLDAFIHNFYSY